MQHRPDANQELRAYYASRASYYDEVYKKPERRADIAFLKEYLPLRFAGLTVLEVACGTGYWTQDIARMAARLVATDAMTEPMEFARLRPGVERVEFVMADALSLPSNLGRFEAAFAGLWLSHVPVQDRSRFFASLHERLLPGARVVMIDNSEVQRLEHPIRETDGFGNTYQHRRLKDGSVHRVLKNFPTEEELKEMVGSVAESSAYRKLENFWMFQYVLRDC